MEMSGAVGILASWQGGLRLRGRAGTNGDAVFVVEELEEDGTVMTSATYRDDRLFAAIQGYKRPPGSPTHAVSAHPLDPR